MKIRTFTNNTLFVGALLGAAMTGCGSDEETPDNGIDQALLTEYRKALPKSELLEASAPTASTLAAVGDPALYPNASWDIVVGINGAVTGIIDVMGAVVATQPSLYNSETKEFFWGPFPNDDGFGYVAAYIRDAGEQADFRYHYALLRGVGNDVATLTPVIWGGANPGPEGEDRGSGVTLWDFEANYAFEEANNPDYQNVPLDRGRFVALYGKGPDENDANNEVTLVVSAFRNFVPQDNPGAAPADLDYFYGRFASPDFTVDFIDWQAGIDVSDPADGVAEDVGVRMAFLNEGTGRAEAYAVNGSLEAGDEIEATECWDTSITETYLYYEFSGTDPYQFIDGAIEDCGLFQATLDELKVPKLADVDPALLDVLDNVAQNGIPQE